MTYPARTNKPVTLKDIAAHCGVGKSIVSYALRGVPCVKPETRARILAAAAELGYDPAAQDAARRLVAHRHAGKTLAHMVALVLPQDFYQGEYFSRLFRGVMDVLPAAGFDVILLHPGAENAGAIITSPSIRRGDVDGIIAFSPGELSDEDIATLRGHVHFGNRPIVSLINPLSTCSSVTTADEDAAYQSVRYLWSLGHSAMLQCTTWGRTNDARIAGAARAVVDAGGDPARDLHRVQVPFAWMQSGVLPREAHRLEFASGDATLPAYLQANSAVTAVLAWNDACALYIHRQLLDAGVRVPDDISIIGFDDTDPLPDGGLTTVALPLVEVGRTAASLLLRQLAADDPTPEHIVLPAPLIPRGTTAARA
jgi:DNA-binding LacI/PurR family transcriptional regulator